MNARPDVGGLAQAWREAAPNEIGGNEMELCAKELETALAPVVARLKALIIADELVAKELEAIRAALSPDQKG